MILCVSFHALTENLLPQTDDLGHCRWKVLQSAFEMVSFRILHYKEPDGITDYCGRTALFVTGRHYPCVDPPQNSG